MKKSSFKTRVMTIVHGKSEYCICSSIKSNLRIKHEIYADKKGAKSIQIDSLMNVLESTKFNSFRNFTKHFPDVAYHKKRLIDFKLFIIMDLDDCSIEMRNRYLNKEMFAKHWLYEYIVPIYNDPNLEQTMCEAGVTINKNEKKKYFTVFPTNHGDLDIEMAQEFLESLKQCKNSNLAIYVEHCLSLVLSVQQE